MKEFAKGKLATTLIVIATMILAGVAIFTALRLYQLRKESISLTTPESEPLAWDCSKYVFILDKNGLVTVTNNSTGNEPPQQAKVYINDALIATYDVPALSNGQKVTLGTVQVPSQNFSWKIVGTKDCQNSGQSSSSPKSCSLLTFSLTKPSETPTNTPTEKPTSTPTNTPTPTDQPRGGVSPTPTNTPVPTENPTSNPTSTPTPTTPGSIAAASPTPGGSALPNAGVSQPTIIVLALGILLILGAMILAI